MQVERKLHQVLLGILGQIQHLIVRQQMVLVKVHTQVLVNLVLVTRQIMDKVVLQAPKEVVAGAVQPLTEQPTAAVLDTHHLLLERL